MSPLTRATRALIAPILLLALAGCGGSAVTQGDLEGQIGELFTEQTGQEFEKVACEDDLEAEKGATQRCTITTEDDTIDVDAEVTSVEDETVSFDITEVVQ